MNRRHFLQRIAPTVVGSSALVTSAALRTESGDDFHYRGWRVSWSGWREPVNQMVSIGFWTAHRDGDDRVFYATSLGKCDETRECYVLDMTHDKDWPRLDHRATPDERDDVKRRAKETLLVKLRTL